MRNIYSISLDYHRALAQAAKLDQAAGIIKRQRDSVQDIQGNVAACWEGEDADAYLAKMRILEEDLRKEEKNIRNAADAIRTIARKTYEAEQRSLELALQRTYN